MGAVYFSERQLAHENEGEQFRRPAAVIVEEDSESHGSPIAKHIL